MARMRAEVEWDESGASSDPSLRPGSAVGLCEESGFRREAAERDEDLEWIVGAGRPPLDERLTARSVAGPAAGGAAARRSAGPAAGGLAAGRSAGQR